MKSLTAKQNAIDRKARQVISREMGHGREQVTAVYLGRQGLIATDTDRIRA